MAVVGRRVGDDGISSDAAVLRRVGGDRDRAAEQRASKDDQAGGEGATHLLDLA